MAKKNNDAAEVDVNKLMADSDTGGRNPPLPIKKPMLGVTLARSMFPLWVASPLPFIVGVCVFHDPQPPAVYPALSVFLAYPPSPAFSHSPAGRTPGPARSFSSGGSPAASSRNAAG